jgi:hypothetical protein
VFEATRMRTLLLAFLCLAMVGPATAQQPSRPRFEIIVPPSVHSQPITGRVFVMIARADSVEPRLQIGRTGSPFFGRDIERLSPGSAAVIDATDLGFPLESLTEVPAGEYFVQAVVNVYSEFRRSDGHVVWMHDDQWEGQQFQRSPGNLHSAIQRVKLDPKQGYTIRLVADKVIPPIETPADNEWVQRFRFQSPILTKFWGRPIHLGATVYLPRDYARTTVRYPINYVQGHFSDRPLGGLIPGSDAHKEWIRDDFPRVIVATFQHPNPYFDDSYAVNSPNVGPYGDAILKELIPEIEKRYRVIQEPWARWLSGGSTGGWESFALMVFHPDFFGATWSSCPDPLTFTDVEGVDFYRDTNAFYKQNGWVRTPTVNSREINGQVRLTSEQRNRYELVKGTKGRSGEQIDIWSAVWSPVGKDGYFEPAFDKRTGEINPRVVQYWKENWDFVEYMKKNWSWLGPKLVDRLHVTTGDVDTYFLNNSTMDVEAFLKTTSNPHYEGSFIYGRGKPHCWGGPLSSTDRIKEMAMWGLRHKPAQSDTPWWTYR